jgi:hypothetical protein
LVPPGVQAPELVDYAALVEALASELEARADLARASSPEDVLNNLTSGCRQPALLQLLVAELFDGATKAPVKMRPQPGSMVPMLATLKVLINEMDRALRAG